MERKPQDAAPAPGSSKERHLNLSNAVEREAGNHISTDVPSTRGPPAPNPQPQPAISSHYPALAFGGTITVSQPVTTNAAQNTASTTQRPGPASETLTREQAMDSKPPFSPIQPAWYLVQEIPHCIC